MSESVKDWDILIARQSTIVGRCKKAVARVQERLRLQERRLDEMAYSREARRKADVLERGLDPGLTELYNRVREAVLESSRTDIMISRRDTLTKQEIPKRIAEIQAVCGHPLVTGYASQQGSSMRDYEDGYRGRRICAVCQFTEEAVQDSRKGYLCDAYATLAEAEFRIILTTGCRREARPTPWLPVAAVLMHFRERAGARVHALIPHDVNT